MDLKEKLYNSEHTPPPSAWDRIAAALDESHLTDRFPSKLYNAEVTPPATAWEKITSTLDEGQAPVMPMRRKSPVFVRYAAAIAILAILTFGIVKWNSNEDESSAGNGVANTTDSTVPATNNNLPSAPDQSTVAHTVEPREDDTIGNDRFIANTDMPERSVRVNAKNDYANYHFSESIGAAVAMLGYSDPQPNLSDRYVMLMTPNGIVRMSKKLGDIICCVAGEEEDEECKDQLKKWQEKLANSTVVPAPGNFMDILTIVNTLNEPEL